MINPFQVTKPVEPAEVIDRQSEMAQLVALAEEGNNARLVAPRRYGKTSILRRVQAALSESEWTTVYVDLLGIVTPEDFSARIERAYVEQLKGAVAQWFIALRRSLRPTITLGGGPIPASGSLDLTGRAKEALVDRLALPMKVFEKTGKRVHVVFDEFQELDVLEGSVDAVMRSEIQHHGDAASYVFAGSQLHMMEMMFTQPQRAFYRQAERVALTPLGPLPLGEYLLDRFGKTGKELTPLALDGLLDLVQGHPQRAMAATRALWDATDTVADIGEWSEARNSLMDEVDDELKAIWLELSAGERQSLVAVAQGRGPYQRGGPGSRGAAVARALESLEGRGVFARVEGGWYVVDPLFAEWVRGQRGAP